METFVAIVLGVIAVLTLASFGMSWKNHIDMMSMKVRLAEIVNIVEAHSAMVRARLTDLIAPGTTPASGEWQKPAGAVPEPAQKETLRFGDEESHKAPG